MAAYDDTTHHQGKACVRVHTEVLALGGPPRRSHGAVRLVRRCRSAARVEHPCVHLLQMFGFEPVEPVASDGRHEVLVDGEPVAGQGARPDGGAGDVLDPVGEPLLDRPALVGLRQVAAVEGLLDRPDLAADLLLGPASDVATIRPGEHRP
jgi:hypothetical protein